VITSLKNLYPFIVFIGIVFILLSIVLYISTFKYKKKKLKFLAIFASLSKRNIILLSTIILNFLIVVYYSVQIKYFSNIVIYLIIVNAVISVITALNIHMLISTIIYDTISIISLKILSLVYNYLENIYYNKLTFILGIIFLLLLNVYEIYVTFRQVEIVFNNKERNLKWLKIIMKLII